MFLHFLEHVVGAVGVLDDDNLHLGELVQTVETADILAVAAGLAAEALAVADALDGELLGVDHLAAEDIRYRHLSGGDHVETVERDGVHLALLVGQLTGAETRGLVDHQRRLDFDEASIGGLIEEEVDEGALQAGTFAFIEGESGTGNLVAEFEVDDVVFGAEIPMGQCIGRQVRFYAILSHHHVVGLTLAHRNGDMRCVRQRD